jgi:hypothetical protein
VRKRSFANISAFNRVSPCLTESAILRSVFYREHFIVPTLVTFANAGAAMVS